MTHPEPLDLSERDWPWLVARRLDEIEQALKFTPDRSYRRELVKEYLRLTEPETMEIAL